MLPAGLSGVDKLRQSLIQNKLNKVAAGTKVVKPPKTIFGKAFGKLTGRTQAAELQKTIQMNKQKPLPKAAAKSVARATVPVTGTVDFGKRAQTKPNLPIILGALVALVLIFKPKGRKGRRR